MSKDETKAKKAWPQDCIWPKPLSNFEGMNWEEDDVDPFTVDEIVEDLLEVKAYFDRLVEDGFLNEDYTLNEDYESDDEDFDSDNWEPEQGEDYWEENHFDLDYWNDSLSEYMNQLKIDFCSGTSIADDPVSAIHQILGYRFINENLIRQAFTRRAFAIEYGLFSSFNKKSDSHAGCSEELEFLGDSILNMIVTKEILKHHAYTDSSRTYVPFQARYDEGLLSKMKSRFICQDHLAMRASILGLDKYILYGTGEKVSESAKEDMIEALIGAVAVDSDWNMEILEDVIDRLIDLQVECPDSFLKKSYYDILASWHQKHFGKEPDYEVDRCSKEYSAILRFHVPQNNKGIRTSQLVTATEETRSAARNTAAEKAYNFIIHNGLWANIEDSKITPDMENSIGQLQELYQKKYIQEMPVYEFSEESGDIWFCDCYFDSFHGYGKGKSKVKAKKKAAYMGLVRLFQSAGCAEKEWEDKVWENVMNY